MMQYNTYSVKIFSRNYARLIEKPFNAELTPDPSGPVV